MVARTPPKQQRSAALNPLLLRETIQKMERCMNRLQELQYTVTGGTKVISGVSLSPRSTRAYLKTSLRCKQESLRMKNATPRKSPAGKFPANKGGDWRRMSLPAMLLGETVGEILQASQFARQIVAAVDSNTTEDPKTPLTGNKCQKINLENTELRTRRKREKLNKLQSRRSETNSPLLQRARSRINFKVSPPKMNREQDKENSSTKYLANRVSPRNRPWVRKTVLFPNPLFLSTSSCQQQRFTKTRSPVISRKRETPHKFLIKSPPSASKSQAKAKTLPASKFQVKIKSPPKFSISPTRPSKKSPKVSTASKFCRSFSPSRIVTRLASPLKGRKSVQKIDGLMSGLKQRPTSTPMRVSSWRI